MASSVVDEMAKRKVEEDETQVPPQGGEAKICFTMFISLVLSILSAVTMLYATVIIYKPSMQEIKSGLEGPKVCTTMESTRGLTKEQCVDSDNLASSFALVADVGGTGKKWSSCEEWCLGLTYETCSHVYASVREIGIDLELSGCEFTVNHTCDLLEHQRDLNCKLRSDQLTENMMPGDKDICASFDAVQISCTTGVCRNISAVYKCSFMSVLDDISAEDNGACIKCPKKKIDNEAYCQTINADDSKWNETISSRCAPCSGCWETCYARRQCFNMKRHWDSTLVGRDEYDRPLKKYYDCKGGRCVEIYDMKCDRRCHPVVIDVAASSTIVLSQETVLAAASCSVATTTDADGNQKKLTLAGKSKDPMDPMLVVSCARLKFNSGSNTSAFGIDCVDAVWLKSEVAMNYSELKHSHEQVLDRKDNSSIAKEFPTSKSLTISNRTKIKINLEGCVNTLSKECTDFYRVHGRDGRNATSRSIYPCYYDAALGISVIQYNPAATLRLLILFASIPSTVFVVTCAYLCFCNRAVRVGADGRMRLRLSGKYYTGIGNVEGLTNEELEKSK